MSIARDNATLYVCLVAKHLQTEWVDESGKSLPNSYSTFEALLEANDSIKRTDVGIPPYVYDCYEKRRKGLVYKIQCITEADAISLQNDIEDWNEEQVEDCFGFNAPFFYQTDKSYNRRRKQLVSSLSANTPCK